jgi:hypothetical protein
MSDAKTIGFVVNCEVPGNRVTISSDNLDTVRIPFNVTRQEDGPARVEAHIIPLGGPVSELSGQPLPPERWGGWLSLEGDQEQGFDDAGFRNYTVLVNLPPDGMFPLGAYQFKLRVLGVDDPDERFAESDVVTIQITGKEPSPNTYVVSILAVLLVVVALIVAGAMFFLSQATLSVDLVAPKSVQTGQVATYMLHITNPRSITVTNVVMQYKPPYSFWGGTANVPGAAYRQCDTAQDKIWCDLGSLAAGETVSVTLRVIPDPNIKPLTNTNVISVTCNELKPSPAQPNVEQTTVEAGQGISMVMVPSVGLAYVDEPLTVDLMVWDNAISPATSITVPGVLATPPLSYTLVYRLPQGMRYAQDPPVQGKNCSRPTYFEIECPLMPLADRGGKIDRQTISIELIPTHLTDTAPLHMARLVDSAGNVTEARLAVPVAETSLFFDGVDDYAELGYTGLPDTFTLEFWVHPYSTDDGQNFVGVHDKMGRNLLLVGYYEGGLHVNLRDSHTTVPGLQSTDRQHLAVVVENSHTPRPTLTIYKDGQVLTKTQVSPPADASPATAETLNWVLGQDWDGGQFGPVTSDFFHGRLSDIRLWEEVRSDIDGNIQKDMNLRLSADDIKKETGLIGYWPLVPEPNPDTPALIDRVSLYRPDTGENQAGRRLGASWTASPLQLGGALEFNGVKDVAGGSGLALPAHELAAGEPYAVTFAAWMYVTGDPSQEQWIVGQAVGQPGETTGAPAPETPVAPALVEVDITSSAVISAQAELVQALQASRAVTMTVEEALAARQQARNDLKGALPRLAPVNTADVTLTKLNAVITAETNFSAALMQTTDFTATKSLSATLEARSAELVQAQHDLDQVLLQLEPELQRWLDVVLRGPVPDISPPLPPNLQYNLYEALLALGELKQAEADLKAARRAEADIRDAQAKLAAAEIEADRARQEAQETEAAQARVMARERDVQAARQALGEAPPGDVPAAGARLADAQAALAAAQGAYLAELSALMADIQKREDILADLSRRLPEAATSGLSAGLDAARQQSVERWIGPFLDFVLGTRTPQKSAQEMIYQAALMAARQKLKSPADFEVDQAQAELDAALEKRDLLRNAREDRVELRQQIIDNIKAYLDSLDKEVNAARQKLAEAKQKQQGQAKGPDLSAEMGEALSRAVAQAVTNQLVRALQRTDIETLIANQSQRDQLETTVKAEIDVAVNDALRRPRVRLYAWSSFLRSMLAGDPATPARKTAQSALERLGQTLIALLSYTRAEGVGPGVDLGALVEQAAAAVETDTLDRLTQDYRDALTQAKRALDTLILVETGASRLPVATATPAQEPAPTPEPTAAPTQALTGTLIPPPAPTPEAASTPTPTPAPAQLSGANLWGGLVVDRRGYVGVVARQEAAINDSWVELPDRRPIPTNRWVHYAGVITYTAGLTPEVKLYRDGADVKNPHLVTPSVDLRLSGCATGVYVGGLCPAGDKYFFMGRLDDIRIWERALTPEEVTQWMTRPDEAFDEVAYWPLNDGPGRREPSPACGPDQSCDRSKNKQYHLFIAGPRWVDADFGGLQRRE